MPTRVGFVGRLSELSVLDERLAAARTGHPQVVYLEGEAGAGKSTVLARFLGSLSEPVKLFETNVQEIFGARSAGWGLLIHAAPGSSGGVGALFTNRSGWAA